MTDTTTHTFRPSWKAYKAFLVSIPIAAVVFVVLFAAFAGRSTAFGGLLIILSGVVIAMLLVIIFMKVASITITNDSMTYRKPFHRRTLRLGEDVEGILIGYSDTTGGGIVGNSSRSTMLFLYSKTQRKRMRVHGGFWTVEDMKKMAQLAGAKNLLDYKDVVAFAEKENLGEVSMITGVTTKMLAKSHSYFLSWPERHPVIFTVGGAIVGLIVFVVIIFVVTFIINPEGVPWDIRKHFL